MHVEQYTIAAAEAVGRLAVVALEALPPIRTLIAVLLVPAGLYVLSQIGAAIIGLYAQRYWITAFEERERNLIEAHGTLRAMIRRLARANARLASQNALLVWELDRAVARADEAEARLSEALPTQELDFVI